MQMIVTGRNTHVSSHMKEVASSKLERIHRYFDRIQSLEVEFSEEHNPRIAEPHIVEVTLKTKAHTLRAHAAGVDFATAVDRVAEKLERQVKRLKGKIVRGGVAKGGAKRGSRVADEMPPAALNGSAGEIGSPPEGDGTDAPRITRIKRFSVKPMTAEEAVLQMESLGHDFYLFVNPESEQAGVVYRRRDGSFGLIEPD